MFPRSQVYISSVVQCVQCTAASVVRALNFPWETTLCGRAVSWLGWAWTRGNILHTSHYIVNTAPFVTLLYGIYQQYLHISHSIISLSSSHTRTQRDKQVSIRQQVIFCISYVTASRHCSSDMMVSVAERGSGVLSLLSPSSQCLLQAGCQTADNGTAEWRASSHHHTTSTILSLVTVTKGWCHNSHNSHISHNTLVTNTPRLGRGCRLLTAAEEERWPALMRTEQRPQEEGNYCSGGEAVSVSPSYPRGSPCIIHS